MIRSELDVLLDKVQDEALRADLRTQIERLKQRRSFGLVFFERHIPERVRLPQHPIRVGSQVVSRDDDDSPTYEVEVSTFRFRFLKRPGWTIRSRSRRPTTMPGATPYSAAVSRMAL